MPSLLTCTGPAHCFIGSTIGANPAVTGSPLLYLGTCAETPVIRLLRKYREVQNDIAGDVPMDLAYMGQMAHINLDLSRWDEAVWRDSIASFPHQSAALTGSNGTDTLGDIGALIVSEGRSLELQILFPYAAKPAMAAAPLPPGYRFPYCFPPEDQMHQLGTRPRKLNVQLMAIRGYDPNSGAQLLYDTNVIAALGVGVN